MDQTVWLLEEDNPSVRYFTLVDLLEKSKEDPEALKAKAEIMQKGVVAKILATQVKRKDIGKKQRNFIQLNIKGRSGKFLSWLSLVRMEKIVGLRELANFFLRTLKIAKVMVFIFGSVPRLEGA